MTATVKNSTENIDKFSKKQLINSKKFAFRADLLKVILDEKELYSIEETEKANFYERQGEINVTRRRYFHCTKQDFTGNIYKLLLYPKSNGRHVRQRCGGYAI